jgi:hypothetical protein
VGEELTGFLDTLDRVVLGGRAESQAVNLRKDEPHPVAEFVATPDFCDGTFVDALLRNREASQIERVSMVAGLIAARHGRLLDVWADLRMSHRIERYGVRVEDAPRLCSLAMLLDRRTGANEKGRAAAAVGRE